MRLESLANELLLEVFEYLDGTHLFRAFYGLNIRFNHLLLLHHRIFHFNFQQIPKEDFDVICQQYLPSVIDRVTSIEISDDVETPKLPQFFLDYGFTLNQLINLKRLTLRSMNTLSILIELTSECQSFPNLEQFSMIDCFFSELSQSDTHLFDNIWKLSKLTSFNFHSSVTIGKPVFKISQQSSTITNLTIGNCVLWTFGHLIQHTPNLQRLDISVYQYFEELLLNDVVSSITYLKISFSGASIILINMFDCVPNLHHLILKTTTIDWNGYEWKDIIEKYFPKLKVLQFKIVDYLLEDDMTVDDLLETFRTSFWLEEHQWFVGCQWNPDFVPLQVNLYTLPYRFDSILYRNDRCFESTCLYYNNYYSFDSVHALLYSANNASFFDKFPLRFPNIQHLSIQYPFTYESLLRFPLWNQLKSISIPLLTDDDYVHLQLLLDQAPHLYSITFGESSRLSKRFLQLTSSSVRKLHLFPSSSYFCLNTQDCTRFISSSLGRQCEVLSVQVNNRNDILKLMQQMSNLRSLTFCYRDVLWSDEDKRHELIHWLEDHLPSTCTFRENPGYFYRVEIWIHRQRKDTAVSSKAQNKLIPLATKLKGFFKNFRSSN